ncbi:MAG: ribosome silencing factor [Clostridia bacterium]|nr:ribosome silencing factor [Clostridia bacterium]
MTSKEKALKIADILGEKKGEEVVLLNLEGLSDLTNYFVVCTAMSNNHVKALIDEVEYEMEKINIIANTKSYKADDWQIIDYFDVIVHVFTASSREKYDLEGVWKNAEFIRAGEDNE